LETGSIVTPTGVKGAVGRIFDIKGFLPKNFGDIGKFDDIGPEILPPLYKLFTEKTRETVSLGNFAPDFIFAKKVFCTKNFMLSETYKFPTELRFVSYY
jgi:hypothetical protein